MASISSETSWNNFLTSISPNDSSNRYNGTIDITANFSFSGIPTPIFLDTNALVNGNCHTITLTDNSSTGLFSMPTSGTATCEIKNLTVDCSGLTFGTGTNILLFNDGTLNNQRGVITNVHTQNGTLTTNIGGFLCSMFGDNTATDLSLITNCSVILTLSGAFGFCFSVGYVLFDRCYYNGTMTSIQNAGFCGNNNNLLTITNSYVKTNNITNASAGFVGQASKDLTMSNCYVVGDIIGLMGAGFVLIVADLNTVNFTNCYYAGDITSGSINTLYGLGGFIGSLNASTGLTCNLTNCYSAVTTTIGGSFIYKSTTANSSIAIVDCHSISGTSFIITDNGSVDVVTGISYDLGFGTIYGWSSSVWSSHASDYPTLNIFNNLFIWDGTYILSTDAPDFKACSYACNCAINIGSQTEWNSFIESISTISPNSASNRYNGNINITANFSFTGIPTPIYLGNNASINGQCYVLTLTDNGSTGLFSIPTSGTATCEIKNLTVDCSGLTFDTGTNILLFNDATLDNQRGIITNVHTQNGTLTNNIGGLLCDIFGDNTDTYQSIISKCSVTLTLNKTGGYGNTVRYTLFDKCFYNGSMITNLNYGFCVDTTNCSITNSYVNTTIIGNSSGFIGSANNTLTMSNCYVIGDITAISGSGFVYTAMDSSTINIDNCYYNGNATSGSITTVAGFIRRLIAPSSVIVNLTNCYSTISNTLAGSFIYSSSTANSVITLTDCHSITGTTFVINPNGSSVSTPSSASDLGFGTIYGWSSLVWSSHLGDYPTLNQFNDLSIWDNTYTLSTDTPNFKVCILACNCSIVPCFAENTPIKTSNGIKLIQHLRKGDVIDGYEIETIVRSQINNRIMIKIEKDAINTNLPSQDTFVTKQHLFEIDGKQVSAGDMTSLNPSKIYQIKPISEYVYHIILKNRQYAFITVNGLKAETLGLKFQKIMSLKGYSITNQIII